MSKKRFSAAKGLLAAGFLLAGLLGGPPPVLMAQSAAAPTEEAGGTEERKAAEEEPGNDTGEDGKAAQDRGSAYRRQPDSLRPFEPSEEIRVDKAVDFPADI